MKPYNGSDQDWHLYNYKWNLAKDTYLINKLVEREAECKRFPSPADSPHALISAMEALNKEMEADLTYNDVLERVEFLRRRYDCFKKLASRVETTWDVPNNRVTADDKVWEVIFRDDHFTRAYHQQGDPLWFKLCRLFGYNSIKQEHSPTLILISDSPSALCAPSTHTCISISDDEVTSPVLKEPTAQKEPTARKLDFDDDAESSVGPTAPAKGAEHSSCASSSPFK